MNGAERDIAYQLIYSGCEPEPGRFTSDLPINSEVWILYATGDRFGAAQGLLLTPHNAVGVAALRESVTKILTPLDDSPGSGAGGGRYMASIESHLLVHLDFFELLALLPLTAWWATSIQVAFDVHPDKTHGEVARSQGPTPEELAAQFKSLEFAKFIGALVFEHLQPEMPLEKFKQVGVRAVEKRFAKSGQLHRSAIGRLINVAGLYLALTLLGKSNASFPGQQRARHINDECHKVLSVLARCLETKAADRTAAPQMSSSSPRSPLWQVSFNRPAEHAVFTSRKTVKADAAIRVFDTGGQGIRWAVIDSGVDARHPGLAFADKLTDPNLQIVNGMVAPSLSRVIMTLDFTRLAAIAGGHLSAELKAKLGRGKNAQQLLEAMDEAARHLANGKMIDWALLEPLLLVDQTGVAPYDAPQDSHGTHVAGIIGASWKSSTYTASAASAAERVDVPSELADCTDLLGMCPRIEILDLRVFGPNGSGDEFSILAALQYVRYLNQSKDRQYVHGINLSLSLRHDVRNFACGSTPVCLECDRLVGSGVVVVAAAGNYGYDDDYSNTHLGGAFRGQSITDPGNAAAVITVGSTHRTDPYQYGISYFSSHGPTGDGRSKPDLVAPGEKITSLVPEGTTATMDGTSMAAPHVSGLAALLIARNNELMGQPERVKEILCSSASNLGRGRDFQGAGLVDALRALQAI